MGRVACTVLYAVLVAAAAAHTPARPVRYQAVLLHPPGAWASRAFACGGGVQAGATYAETGAQDRAIVWSGAADRTIDLTPAGYQTGVVYATDGFRQVGFVQAIPFGSAIKAALWYGSPESFVDLHPSGWETSFAEDVSGGRQVGWGTTAAGRSRALLWSGSRESVLDLTPSGYRAARAYGIAGNLAVGGGSREPLQYGVAVLWDLASGTARELDPMSSGSVAVAVHGNLQVGTYWQPVMGQSHAVLWRGSPTSFFDLHPSGYTRSEAFGTNGSDVVGTVRGSANFRAAVLERRHRRVPQFAPVSAAKPRTYRLDRRNRGLPGQRRGPCVQRVEWFLARGSLEEDGGSCSNFNPMKRFWWIAWAAIVSPILAQGDEVLIGYGYEPSVAANEKRNQAQEYRAAITWMRKNAQGREVIGRTVTTNRGASWLPNLSDLFNPTFNTRAYDPSLAAKPDGGPFLYTYLQFEAGQTGAPAAWYNTSANGEALNLTSGDPRAVEVVPDREWAIYGAHP